MIIDYRSLRIIIIFHILISRFSIFSIFFAAFIRIIFAFWLLFHFLSFHYYLFLLIIIIFAWD